MQLIRCDKCKVELKKINFEGRMFEITGDRESYDDDFTLCKKCAKQFEALLKKFFKSEN